MIYSTMKILSVENHQKVPLVLAPKNSNGPFLLGPLGEEKFHRQRYHFSLPNIIFVFQFCDEVYILSPKIYIWWWKNILPLDFVTKYTYCWSYSSCEISTHTHVNPTISPLRVSNYLSVVHLCGLPSTCTPSLLQLRKGHVPPTSVKWTFITLPHTTMGFGTICLGDNTSEIL